jgi:phospholipase A1
MAVFMSAIFSTMAQIMDNQVYNPDSVRAEFDKRPYFSLMKDNYLTFGSSVSQKPTSGNSNVKIQLSVNQRLTKSKLPFDSYLFVGYTQKIYWSVFQSSAPINEFTFNPTIGLSRLLIKGNKYIGKSSVMI